MGITTQWYGENQQAILHIYDDLWTTQDYFDALVERDQLTNSVKHPVIIMSNYLEAPFLPKGFVLALQSLNRTKPDNEKTHIIISQTDTHSLILKVIDRIQPGAMPTLYAVSTVQEAEIILEQLVEKSAAV